MVEPGYVVSHVEDSQNTRPILVCLLGEFRVLKAGRPVTVHSPKAEALLRYLGLQHERPVPRDTLLELLWPGRPPDLAGQSLNSLVHSLRKSLGDEIQGASPVLQQDGYYRLNEEAGVGVDMAYFEALANAGDQYVFNNNWLAAIPFYTQAIHLYRGDLLIGADVSAIVERERLRAHFLSLLASLADYSFSVNDYGFCLYYAERLLRYDACREDAYRLMMRCYVRRGERAQALRQYRLCQTILQAEYDAAPEPSTTLLYDQVRLDPASI
jgi:DNA-binding SARP family transcriptional activator